MSGRPRNTARRYIVNAGSSLATTLIRMSFLVWINQYLLRRIAPEEYALIPVVMALMVVIELFPMVFLRGLSRFMVEADARDDAEGWPGSYLRCFRCFWRWRWCFWPVASGRRSILIRC